MASPAWRAISWARGIPLASADLVVRAVHIFHMEGVLGAVQRGLDDLQHLGEENVAAALDDDQNGVGVALLELLGVQIQLKAALLHRGENGRPGLLADVGMVVQHPGNGADGISGFGCQILDGHADPPLEK